MNSKWVSVRSLMNKTQREAVEIRRAAAAGWPFATVLQRDQRFSVCLCVWVGRWLMLVFNDKMF